MQRESRRVFYSGRVQGVGFRFTAVRLASGFDVDGYVRNLPDGRVELVAQGDAAQVDAFLQSVEETLRRNIHDTAIEPGPVSSVSPGEFTIRYD